MPENTYIIRGNDVSFGIPNGLIVPWGVATSVKRKPSNTVAEFTDDDGEIGTRVTYQKKETYTVEVIRGGKKTGTAASLPVPQLDDVVQYDGKNMVISAIDDSYAQGDAQKYSIELTYYPAITMTATAQASE